VISPVQELLLGLALALPAGIVLPLLADRRAQAIQARLGEVAINYAPARPRPHPVWRPDAQTVHAIQERVETALGYRRGRRPHYTTPLRTVLLVAALASSLLALITSRLTGSTGLLVFVPAFFVSVRFYFKRLESRLRERLYVQFPDALAMIIRAVRIGVPVSEAVRLVSVECQQPTTIEFRQLSDEVAIGFALEQSLRSMGDRNDIPEYRFFATALALQSQTGGGLSETLETLADTIRKRVAARARAHALASEARTSCYVLAALPVVLGAGLYAINPPYISILFTTAGGNKLLGLAVLSLGTGLLSMRGIIHKCLS
jgi:tight adherence protein B